MPKYPSSRALRSSLFDLWLPTTFKKLYAFISANLWTIRSKEERDEGKEGGRE